MAGHSKWANIKHRKASQDAQRGKIFTKLIRELVTAAKLGGADIGANPRLRSAIDKALSNNMTRDTINRAIERGVGNNDEANLDTKIYEGYGPGNVAILIECLTDNVNRTLSQIRPCFNKCGGTLGSSGSVGYLFNKVGLIVAECDNEEKITEAVIEAGADDIQATDANIFEIITKWEEVLDIKQNLTDQGFTIQSGDVIMQPTTSTDLDLETAQKLLRLIDMLEDCDDVQNVHYNASISDEILSKLV